MCRTSLIVSLLLPLLPLPAGAQADIVHFRNKNRLLLVFAPSRTDARWVRQEMLLTGSRAQFTDRDLLRFDIFVRGQSRGASLPLDPREVDSLRARYHVRPETFRVLLIGKDGHVAFSGLEPVALSDLTGRIDRMPMRRDEMRRRRMGTGR